MVKVFYFGYDVISMMYSVSGDAWVKGRIVVNINDIYDFEAKVFDTGSEYGIGNGRVSKLNLREVNSTVDLINYDRGWDVVPKDNNSKLALKAILEEFK